MSPAGARAAPEALLLTGPLGAGKTTFLKRTLLPALAGRRVVVLVNDAGALPVDARLLEARVPTIGVADGCFCCHAGGRLLEALARIRDELAPDILILEGSGLSPPGPLAVALVGEGYLHLGTLAVVAADQLERLARDPLLRAQLTAAGAVVLSRADRLDRGGFEAARVELARLGCGPILPAFEGVVRDALAPLLDPGVGSEPSPGLATDHPPTLRLEPSGLPRRSDLLAWLAAAPRGVLRVKGLVQCAEFATLLAVNHGLGETDLRPVDGPGQPGLWVVFEGAEPRAWCDAFPAGLRPDDWAALGPLLQPLGEADARIGAAFLRGRPEDALVAAEAFLEALAAAERPALLTRAGGEARGWQELASERIELGSAARGELDGVLARVDADVVLLVDLPDAIAERVAGVRPERTTLHLAGRTALAAATVSLHLDPEREAALARLASEARRSHAPAC